MNADRAAEAVREADPAVRVLIADDQELLRASFRLLIELTPGLQVVGEAGTGAEAVELAQREQPDVVLMDIRMPELDGIQATRRICGDPRTPRTRVLILTTFDFDVYVFTALRAGASGFLLKDVAPGDLIAAIRAVAAGDSLPASSVTRRLIAHYAAGSSQPAADLPVAGMGHVTDREREVLVLIAGGLSNAEIADRLRLGLATVKTHISRLLAKLHARDRAQLVIAAYESGLVVASLQREGRWEARANVAVDE
ncbi:DNA-binding response regulator [Paractinoplanes deccanensis]|uniref:DNA-binding response regulator n=1 Tax=Paractinoplanes deccanensis TaxID=113561 RepID=A0ABQ3Y309_9ACTN|nr:response regulator transcription factor [Actinoplanes deccanensis]GID74379.1 DNA-binding response regulator [Actinoplanes deccanensis]